MDTGVLLSLTEASVSRISNMREAASMERAMGSVDWMKYSMLLTAMEKKATMEVRPPKVRCPRIARSAPSPKRTISAVR